MGARAAEAQEQPAPAAAPSLTDEGLAIDTLIVSHIDPVEEPMERGDHAARASRKRRGAEARATRRTGPQPGPLPTPHTTTASNDANTGAAQYDFHDFDDNLLDDRGDANAARLVRRRAAPRYERSHIREAKLPYYIPKPPRAGSHKPVRHTLTGYYISRDTIYGPERSGEFYIRDARIYLSRRSLGTRGDIPGAAARELGRTLGDYAGVPRASGTVANRVAGRNVPPIPTGYFTINGRIYGGMGLASDAVAGAMRAGGYAAAGREVDKVSTRRGAADGARNCSAQLAKGEFRICGNLIYGPPSRRVPWLTATAALAEQQAGAAQPAARVQSGARESAAVAAKRARDTKTAARATSTRRRVKPSRRSRPKAA
jgi:hypothetical protein